MNSLRISTDRTELDIPLIHGFLAEQSTWAQGIPRDTLERAIENSLCFRGYLGSTQVAFARVISDYATFANLVALVESVLAHPRLRPQSLMERYFPDIYQDAR